MKLDFMSFKFYAMGLWKQLCLIKDIPQNEIEILEI